jgi:hypothetical protein
VAYALTEGSFAGEEYAGRMSPARSGDRSLMTLATSQLSSTYLGRHHGRELDALAGKVHDMAARLFAIPDDRFRKRPQ